MDSMLAAVVVGVSTVWTAPDAPRGCDAPAIAAEPMVRDWVSGMSVEQRRGLAGRTLTQVLFGDTVLVEEVAGGWARIVAIGQAAPQLDPRGYPGWVPAAHVAAVSGAAVVYGEVRVVDALMSGLYRSPKAVSPAFDVVFGTRLLVLGAARGRFVPVTAPVLGQPVLGQPVLGQPVLGQPVLGQSAPLWADLADLAPVEVLQPVARDVLQVAVRLEGVPYIWGGVSPYGIDCSGLVHLAHRRLGVTVPRDAADQAAASTQVEPGAEAPGDLCFFRSPGKAIDHVGFVCAPGRLLHAPGSSSQVRQDPIDGTLASRLTAIHRTLS